MNEQEEFRALIRGFSRTLESLQDQGVESVPRGEVLQADSSAAMLGASLQKVRETLGECTRCRLSETRQNIVFGSGSETADLMFIGEAPGADEDKVGEPFVGRSGQLLDKMISAMGWSRESVYIANVLKCRPPQNRDPKADEVAQCRPFLENQIRAIAPKVIVTLGKPAAHLILQTKAPISALRGSWHETLGVRVMPTFHPAYLLRDPSKKKEAWSDLQQVMAECESQGIAPTRVKT